MKNSVNWELVIRGLKGLNWNEILTCTVSSLNEALLRVIRNRVSKRTIKIRTGDKPWFGDRRVLLHTAKQKTYRAWIRSRAQAIGRSIGWHVVMYSLCM